MSRKLRAIVFDDNDADRYAVKRLLERRGYEVLEYADPTDCPLLHSHECQCGEAETCCDILITDVNMLRVSGLEFLEKQIQKGCKIPNIAVASGAWMDSNLEHAQRLGCKIIEKTPTWDDLADWLDERVSEIDRNRSLSNWFR
jgi:CheY-like chemotaxis protein